MLERFTAETRNAADPKEVKKAQARIDRRRERIKGAFRAVMSTPAGRMVMWELISSAGVYESPWDGHAMTMAHKVGRSDFGRELVADLAVLDAELFMLMESEARAQANRDAQETDAAHVKPATNTGDAR